MDRVGRTGLISGLALLQSVFDELLVIRAMVNYPREPLIVDNFRRGATWETCGFGKVSKRTGSPLLRLEVSPIAGGTPGRRRLLISPF